MSQSSKSALLALEDGSVFFGRSVGASGKSVGEVVFNTAMSGYQEILSDPSYAGQIITFTHSHIGNTGANANDRESDKIYAAGMVVRDFVKNPSNWRSEQNLEDWLKAHQTVAIADIDTRALTRKIREKGAQKACIVAGENLDEEDAIAKAQNFSGLENLDLARTVSTEKIYYFDEGATAKNPPTVVVYDFGVKKNILRLLARSGLSLIVVNAETSADEILKTYKPAGIFLSNGPGDPSPCDYAIANVQHFLAADVPMFGICLGHQLLALALGAKIEKMKFGHHGSNHPVQDLKTKKVMISAQNHGFAVRDSGLPKNLKITHRSLFDGSIQGVRVAEKRAFGFQGHPEASPGPHDISPLFDHFSQMVRA